MVGVTGMRDLGAHQQPLSADDGLHVDTVEGPPRAFPRVADGLQPILRQLPAHSLHTHT